MFSHRQIVFWKHIVITVKVLYVWLSKNCLIAINEPLNRCVYLEKAGVIDNLPDILTILNVRIEFWKNTVGLTGR